MVFLKRKTLNVLKLLSTTNIRKKKTLQSDLSTVFFGRRDFNYNYSINNVCISSDTFRVNFSLVIYTEFLFWKLG